MMPTGFIFCLVLFLAMVRIQAAPRSRTVAAQAEASGVNVGPDNIGGVVTSSKGPEAGVWVIAETTDLPTKFRKIVVTDDAGRYLLPELPKANYKIWVRGYGLVDSKTVTATPGKTLALTAVIAPNAQAAAQYYPADYWVSIMNLPPKTAFPDAHSRADYLAVLKRGCNDCHQMGNKATRDLEPALGTFKSPKDAWERRLMTGQVGPSMINQLNELGHDRGLTMFADWTNRISAGEVPPAPPRPQGVERNVVVTLWETDTDKSFIHDVIASNERKVTANAYGMVYALDFPGSQIWAVDPRENTSSLVASVPIRNESDRKLFKTATPQTVAMPSPYWGNELVWTDPNYIAMPHMDSKGRIWFHAQTIPDRAPYCKKGSGNPFAENFPIPESYIPRGMDVFDPKTGKFELIDLCLSAGHMAFADDKDETLYYTDSPAVPPRMGGIGWVKTKVWDATHDPQKAMGWCPAVIDYNGDGKTGAYTKPDEPIDPKLDRAVDDGNGYGIAFNPVDKSLWYAGHGRGGVIVPGKIIRMVAGDNPPATCKTEAYEPPFENPKRPGVEAFQTEGIAVDTNGLVWAALTGSGDLASFDRSKCKGPLNGPTATGQHCPEGWTLYPAPGPKFKGTEILADTWYHNWMDRYDALGLGKNVTIICSNGDDSLIAFLEDQKKFVTMRVPYPLDFYTRNVDFRIDDPNAGWKGRGLWTGNEDRVIWHLEGGKGNKTSLAHFQIRPDPLAK
jgi:hypothetical protein